MESSLLDYATLPPNVILDICRRLSDTDLARFMTTTSHIHQICFDELINRETIFYNRDVVKRAKRRPSKPYKEKLPTGFENYIIETPLTRYDEVMGYIKISPQEFTNLRNILKEYYNSPHNDNEFNRISSFYTQNPDADTFGYFQEALDRKLQNETVTRSDLMGGRTFFEGVEFRPEGNTLYITALYGS